MKYVDTVDKVVKPVDIDVYWCVLMCMNVYECVWMCINVYECVLMCINMY
jgi:hypothetical protein